MSLHIGNLSPQVHIGDLEHVFRRFGRCSIRVKDKYGFVVYDYPASAEKALKTLRGTRICGEDLTLSWSKHQPHATQRFGAGGKPFKQPFRKFTAKENNGRGLGSYNRREYEMDFKKSDEGIPIGSSDLVDESNSYHPDDVEGYTEERDHSYLNNHYGFRDTGKNHLGDGRWGEQIVGPPNESYLENDIEFERYDPRHSVGLHEFDENQTSSPLNDSTTSWKSKERPGNIYHAKSHKNCYLCGEVGHKMRNCPLELKRQVDGSRLMYREGDGEPSALRRHQRLLGHGDSSQLQISPSGRKREVRDKKRNRGNNENTDRIRLEKTGGPSSPSIHSGYTSSRAESLSKPSYSLKSSPSHHSGSKTFKSLTVSPSMSSASLPVDLNCHLSPSLNKTQIELKGSVANTMKDLSEKNADCSNSASKESYTPKLDADNRNEKLLGSNAPNSEKISLEEIHTVLKHYGLQCPGEGEKELAVESYFGCGRLWPWEIIYYRRLKKGPISAENYSRRVAQNEKFGIVDKYVRCSSGWSQGQGKRNP